MLPSIPTNDIAYNLLHEGSLALERAEHVGMVIDVDYCQKQEKALERKIDYYKTKLRSTKVGHLWETIYTGKLNFNSDTQLKTILFDKLKLEPHKLTEKGNPSLDDESIEALSSQAEGVHYISKIRKYQKTKNTYIKGMLREQVGGILRPFFNFIPSTYRSSSSNINFQNIPKRDVEMMNMVRQAIYAHWGYRIFAIDFSGIEVRASEFYHKDPVMMEYILKPDANMHRDLAMQLFKLESLDKEHDEEKHLYNGGKNGFVFPQFYGDYYGNNAKSLWKWAKMHGHRVKNDDGIVLKDGTPLGTHLRNQGIKSYQKFEDHVKDVEDDFWNRRFRVYQKWKEDLTDFYNEKGYVETLTGFRTSGVLTRNQIINFPIQGTAFHLLLKTFIEMDKQLLKQGFKSRLMGQIHDEFLIALHPSELQGVVRMALRIIEKKLPKIWPWINTPMEVEAEICPVNRPWNEKKSFNLKQAV